MRPMMGAALSGRIEEGAEQNRHKQGEQQVADELARIHATLTVAERNWSAACEILRRLTRRRSKKRRKISEMC